jgi:DNA-binding MarR family transcriptional regulator
MVQLMRAAGRVERALEEVCAAHGLTHDQYNVLRILRGAHPHGHPRYEIAARLISRAPDVTRLVGRLVRAGLVERYRSEQDQRLSMARVTDAGLRLLAEVDPEIREVHESLAADLNAEEVRALGSLCNAVQGAQRDGEAE